LSTFAVAALCFSLGAVYGYAMRRRKSKAAKTTNQVVTVETLLAMSRKWDIHPEGWNLPCECSTCLEYD
jgi:hypothetical protein